MTIEDVMSQVMMEIFGAPKPEAKACLEKIREQCPDKYKNRDLTDEEADALLNFLRAEEKTIVELVNAGLSMGEPASLSDH